MKIPEFENHCLRPYHQDEAAEVHWVAKEHGRSERTIRNRCVQFAIGPPADSGWAVVCLKSCIADVLDGNKRALDAYLSGQRQCDLVAQYYNRAGLADLLELAEFKAGPWGDS